MIPFPPTLLALYPQRWDRLPDRPWWQKDEVIVSGIRVINGFSRVDGSCAVSHQYQCTQQDDEAPRQHPGFRVGQVWANAKGSATLIDAASADEAGLMSYGVAEDIGAGLSRGGNRRYWSVDVLLVRFTGCFLVADPACPHLAPWAPSKTSETRP